jgi:uncharacterized RDD family membrane protein YckC
MGRHALIGLLAALAIVWNAAQASAQAEAPEPPPVQAVPAEPAPPAAPDVQPVDPPAPFEPLGAPVFRLGSGHTVAAGEQVRDVVVINGPVTIEGDVYGDVVVIAGNARVAGTGFVDGDFVVIGGDVMVDGGAMIGRDLVVIGGNLESPAGFSTGGNQTIIGGGLVSQWLRTLVPWMTRGLLWGRLFVPDLVWLWALAATLLLIYLLIGFVFEAPVRASAGMLADKPLTTFLMGVLVLLLVGPVSVILAVSVIGIVVIPILLCTVLAAGVLGKVGALRWLGGRLIPEGEPDHRLLAARSIVLGSVLVLVAYMIPLLGIATWALLTAAGLGAAAMTVAAGLKRENPPRPAPVVIAAPPAAPMAAAPHVTSADAAAPAASVSVPPLGAVDLTLQPRAGFAIRLGAFVLDFILVLLFFVFFDFDEPGPLFALLLLYHVGFWAWKGTTIGGIICQLRVIRTDGTPLRPVDALVRGLSSIFSLVVLGLGCLWIIRDAERQSWHDKIAGTYVVKVPRNWPL